MVQIIYMNSTKLPETIPEPYFDDLCKEFNKWLREAKPKHKFCYYIGAYVAGKSVGRLAMDAHRAGKVILYQKREDRHFSYWAERK